MSSFVDDSFFIFRNIVKRLLAFLNARVFLKVMKFYADTFRKFAIVDPEKGLTMSFVPDRQTKPDQANVAYLNNLVAIAKYFDKIATELDLASFSSPPALTYLDADGVMNSDFYGKILQEYKSLADASLNILTVSRASNEILGN